MADAEGNDTIRLVVLEPFPTINADEIAETKLAVLVELAEDDPRLIVARYPVGTDRVMYPTDEAFVKATT